MSDITAADFMAAAICIRYWAESDNCDDGPECQENLRVLADKFETAGIQLAKLTEANGRSSGSGCET